MMADPKTPPPPAPVSDGTVFVKNPTGAIHDIDESDPRTQSVVELAKKSHNGWSLASDEEVAAYCEANNLVSPARAGKASKAAKPKAPAAPKAPRKPRQPKAAKAPAAPKAAEKPASKASDKST